MTLFAKIGSLISKPVFMGDMGPHCAERSSFGLTKFAYLTMHMTMTWGG